MHFNQHHIKILHFPKYFEKEQQNAPIYIYIKKKTFNSTCVHCIHRTH